MKIAIIGAGWLGCHMALKLKNHHDITMYDEYGFFKKTSMNNQNRLHLGYHYARSSTTRNMCKDTFNQFISDYNEVISYIPKNIYAVPEYDSFIDFETYLKIFSDYDFNYIDHGYLNNVSGAISVNEMHIDPLASQYFFMKHLKNFLIIKKIDDIYELSKDFDLIINCTNNNLNPILDNSYSEPCTIFVYEKIEQTPFDALTLVDGQLFSIFPYYKNFITVSDVEYTPNSDLTINKRINKIEEKILHYYPEFNNKFRYIKNLQSLKTKPIDKSDSRTPVITIHDNIINCFTGKIQGVYYLEKYVRSLCEF
jgi:hypothetical protein